MADALGYVEVIDPRAFGMLLIEYAIGRKLAADGSELPEVEARKWPAMAEFVQDVEARGIARVPAHMTNLEIVQPAENTIFLRLPPKQMMEEALVKYRDAGTQDGYGVPPFYRAMLLESIPPNEESGLPQLEFFFNRVGDYTMSLCG